MMEKFKKLLKEKAQKGQFLSDGDKSARQDIIDEIKSIAQDSMGGDIKKLKDMKKVTVASPTTEGLKEGLEKAGEVIGEKEDEESEDTEEECPMCKDGEMCAACQASSIGSEMEPEESAEVASPDSDKIAKLEAEIAALKAKL